MFKFFHSKCDIKIKEVTTTNDSLRIEIKRLDGIIKHLESVEVTKSRQVADRDIEIIELKKQVLDLRNKNNKSMATRKE